MAVTANLQTGHQPGRFVSWLAALLGISPAATASGVPLMEDLDEK